MGQRRGRNGGNRSSALTAAANATYQFLLSASQKNASEDAYVAMGSTMLPKACSNICLQFFQRALKYRLNRKKLFLPDTLQTLGFAAAACRVFGSACLKSTCLMEHASTATTSSGFTVWGGSDHSARVATICNACPGFASLPSLCCERQILRQIGPDLFSPQKSKFFVAVSGSHNYSKGNLGMTPIATQEIKASHIAAFID